MRPLIVVILAVLVLSGTKWLIDFNAAASAGRQHGELQLIQAPGETYIEVTMTFDVGPDEFALDLVDAPSLLVNMNGREVLLRTDSISAFESPIVVGPIEGVIVGINEFFVQASPSSLDELKPRAIRVRIIRDGNTMADKSIWPALGDIVQGTVSLEVKPQ